MTASTPEERLADALRAEHAAVFAYGVLGARLETARVALATEGEAAHRARRDALVQRLSTGSATPPPAEPAYALPGPVTDQASALRLAVSVEERTAAVWHLALTESAGDDRRLAAEALVDCAVRATKARAAAGIRPSTVPFPGRES